MAADGLTTIASKYGPAEAVKRLEAAILAKGMTVFAKVDHAAGAKEVDLNLAPTLVVTFGAARAGTPLMQADQSVGIDLPLKVLVWQDAVGTWVSYNRARLDSPAAWAERGAETYHRKNERGPRSSRQRSGWG
jgi:uncharacterized protein (DUF302 family)